MKYRILFIAVFILLNLQTKAQLSEWMFYNTNTKDSILRQITAISFEKYKDNTYDTLAYWNPYDSLSTRQQKEYIRKRDQSSDTMRVVIRRFDKYARDSFYFRIRRDNQLLQDWTLIDFRQSNLFLGNFYILADLPERGHYYEIWFAHNKDFKNVSTYAHADFRPTPGLVGVFFPEQEQALNDAMIRISQHDPKGEDLLPHVDWNKYQPGAKFDTFMNFPANHKFPQRYPWGGLYVYSKYNTIQFLYGTLGDTVALEYQLTPESMEADTLKTWQHTLPGDYLIRLSNIEPGEYRLKVRYNRFNGKISSYSIIIRPMWYETSWANWSKGFLLGLSFVLMPFFVFKRAQKARLRKKEQERAMLDLQMKSYRAQLNPHFIFNALTSIQSLINKQDTAGANRYLGEFSQLLRKTLDEQVTAFWTLQDELDLLKQYIGLEQLRFGLRYAVQVDAGIHTEQVEFPSMLLQPVVENAVRHGISGMAEKGQITITISGTNDHFSISITDNGVGFNTSEATQGNHGLRLTRERIQLFNSHNTGKITFSIASGKGNTTAKFYLEHI